MIVLSTGNLKILLGIADESEIRLDYRPIADIYHDMWTQMRLEGELENYWDDEPKFIAGPHPTVPHRDKVMIDADELRQMISWWWTNRSK